MVDPSVSSRPVGTVRQTVDHRWRLHLFESSGPDRALPTRTGREHVRDSLSAPPEGRCFVVLGTASIQKRKLVDQVLLEPGYVRSRGAASDEHDLSDISLERGAV